jgi:hypothetical protein
MGEVGGEMFAAKRRRAGRVVAEGEPDGAAQRPDQRWSRWAAAANQAMAAVSIR